MLGLFCVIQFMGKNIVIKQKKGERESQSYTIILSSLSNKRKYNGVLFITKLLKSSVYRGDHECHSVQAYLKV